MRLVVDANASSPSNILQFKCCLRSIAIVIAAHFYEPSCPGQETAKRPFGFLSQAATCPHVYQSTTSGRGFTLSLLLLNVKQGSYEFQFL